MFIDKIMVLQKTSYGRYFVTINKTPRKKNSSYEKNGYISSSAERFKRHQDESGAEPDKKADYLLFGGSSLWRSGVPFYEGNYRDTGGSDCHGRGDASVFLFGNV